MTTLRSTLRSTLPLAALALAASCWRTKSPSPREPDPNPTQGKIDVTIASVTLADDCNQGPTTMPPPMPAAKQASSTLAPSAGASAGMARYMSEGDRACEQSSVQLRVANGTQDTSKIAIKKIELLDDHGDKLRDLQPRAPSLWADDGYVTWDQQIAPESVLQVSYALSAPGASSGGTYTVRVIVTAGDGTDHTLEQKLTLEAEASLPPGAVT